MRLASVLLLALVCGPLSAQPLFSGVFNAPVYNFFGILGMDLTATEPIDLVNGCGTVAIRRGSPTGQAVVTSAFCPFIFITVGPNQIWTINWDGTDDFGLRVPPDTYFFEVAGTTQAGGTFVRAFFPIRVDDPLLPTPPLLTASVAGSLLPRVSAGRGGSFDFTIVAPTEPFAIYYLGASATTNVGQSSPPFFIALDADAVFGLAFPNPLASVFQQFIGVLDQTGQASGMRLTVPPGVLPSGFPLAVQAVLFGASTPALTNPQSLATI